MVSYPSHIIHRCWLSLYHHGTLTNKYTNHVKKEYMNVKLCVRPFRNVTTFRSPVYASFFSSRNFSHTCVHSSLQVYAQSAMRVFPSHDVFWSWKVYLSFNILSRNVLTNRFTSVWKLCFGVDYSDYLRCVVWLMTYYRTTIISEHFNKRIESVLFYINQCASVICSVFSKLKIKKPCLP